jgi:hypothetical protein
MLLKYEPEYLIYKQSVARRKMWNSSADIVVGWMVKELVFDSCQGQEILLISTICRPAMRSTQPPIQWVIGALSCGGGGGVARGMKRTPYVYLVPRLRMHGAIASLPHTSSCHGVYTSQKQEYYE